MSFYESLGVSKRINAAAYYTALGGSIMSADVIAAMNDAFNFLLRRSFDSRDGCTHVPALADEDHIRNRIFFGRADGRFLMTEGIRDDQNFGLFLRLFRKQLGRGG